MKKYFRKSFLLAATILVANSSFAQTTAMDFNRNDCNGVNRHLFNDLDAGNAVILEFFMNNCGSCVTAGGKLETMKSALLAQYPGMIKSYAIGYSNSYSTTLVKNWVTNNSFTSIPMDSGAAQVAYYGGFGMPTIVILGGGTNHLVLGSPYVGFSTSDTTQMANDIRNFLNSANGISSNSVSATTVELFPNPAVESMNLDLVLSSPASVSIRITDILGKQLETVATNENHNAGKSTKKISVSQLAKGAYILEITINGNTQYKKFTVSR
jgi:hypothetical protein